MSRHQAKDSRTAIDVIYDDMEKIRDDGDVRYVRLSPEWQASQKIVGDVSVNKPGNTELNVTSDTSSVYLTRTATGVDQQVFDGWSIAGQDRWLMQVTTDTFALYGFGDDGNWLGSADGDRLVYTFDRLTRRMELGRATVNADPPLTVATKGYVDDTPYGAINERFQSRTWARLGANPDTTRWAMQAGGGMQAGLNGTFIVPYPGLYMVSVQGMPGNGDQANNPPVRLAFGVAVDDEVTGTSEQQRIADSKVAGHAASGSRQVWVHTMLSVWAVCVPQNPAVGLPVSAQISLIRPGTPPPPLTFPT